MIEEYEFEEMKKEEIRKNKKLKERKRERTTNEEEATFIQSKTKTVRGEYCKHLWENDIFPKSRKVVKI